MNISPISYPYGKQNYSFGKSTLKSTENETQNTDKTQKENSQIYNYSPGSVRTILLSTLLGSLILYNSLPHDKAILLNNNKTTPSDTNRISASNVVKEDYSSVDVITPSFYDYIGENIKNSDKTDIKYIEALHKKQNEQKQVARAYTDGEYVYLHIDINMDNEAIKDKYEFGINIEALKSLFDIADGGIENNNEITVRDDAYGKYGDETYKDYTQNWFHNGDIIKVPVSSIQKDNINLSGYYQE